MQLVKHLLSMCG
ncbi:hypothetical protein ACOMHN_039028 [Nucella lapillus]